MRKILVAMPIVVAIALGIGLTSPIEQKLDEKFEYRVTLADPSVYKNGIFTDTFEIKKGNYQFSFVPNGDSPKILSITLKGASLSFSEEFHLEGTLHETGISEYYTWDYLGAKEIQISESQMLEITIDPKGNLLGPVSINLITK